MVDRVVHPEALEGAAGANQGDVRGPPRRINKESFWVFGMLAVCVPQW